MRPNNFDLLRLLAAWQVVYCHTCIHLEIDSGIGNPVLSYVVNWFQGVPIFFTISGFLISRSWERSRDFKDYATKRALRIYPALWFQLAVSVVLVLAFGAVSIATLAKPSFLAWVTAQATCFQFYNPNFLRGFGKGALNGSLWTIPVELGFYLTLPVLYSTFVNRVRQRWADCGLGVIATLSFVYWFQLSSDSGPPSNWVKLQGVTPLPHLHMFLIGVLAQRNFKRLLPLISNLAPVWLGVYATFMMTCNPWGREMLSTSMATVFVGRLLLAVTVLSMAFSGRSISERLLGGHDISYGVYLYHGLAINAFVELGWTGSEWHFIAVAVVTTIFAVFSWRVVEYPALAWKPVAESPQLFPSTNPRPLELLTVAERKAA